MTEYLKDKFTVPLGSSNYRDNWDRIFGKKEEEKPANNSLPMFWLKEKGEWPDTVCRVMMAEADGSRKEIGVAIFESEEHEDVMVHKDDLISMLVTAYLRGRSTSGP